MFIGLRAFAWLSVCVGAFGVVAVFWTDRGTASPALRASHAPAAGAARSPRFTSTGFAPVWHPVVAPRPWSGMRQSASNVFAKQASIASTGSARRASPPGFHFDPYVRYHVGQLLPVAVAVGDVSGDKRDDVIVVNGQGWLDPTGTHEVWVFRQGADGTLLAPDKYDFLASFTQHGSVELGDLDEDGVLDIVVGHDEGVTTLVHDGDGFVVTLKPISNDGWYVGVLDVDRDGHLDVFAQDWSIHSRVLLGDGQGGLGSSSIVDTPGAGYTDLKIGDANADGTGDIVMTGSRRVDIMGVSPLGGFLPTQTIDLKLSDDWGTASALIDVDGDARKDLAVAHGKSGVVKIFRQGADGLMATTSTLQFDALGPPGEPGVLVAADLDNNFTVDLIVLHNRQTMAGYYLRKGQVFDREVLLTWFGEGQTYETDALAIGDVDGNGCRDLVIADLDDITVYRGQGCLPRPIAQRASVRLAARVR